MNTSGFGPSENWLEWWTDEGGSYEVMNRLDILEGNLSVILNGYLKDLIRRYGELYAETEYTTNELYELVDSSIDSLTGRVNKLVKPIADNLSADVTTVEVAPPIVIPEVSIPTADSYCFSGIEDVAKYPSPIDLYYRGQGSEVQYYAVPAAYPPLMETDTLLAHTEIGSEMADYLTLSGIILTCPSPPVDPPCPPPVVPPGCCPPATITVVPSPVPVTVNVNPTTTVTVDARTIIEKIVAEIQATISPEITIDFEPIIEAIPPETSITIDVQPAESPDVDVDVDVTIEQPEQPEEEKPPPCDIDCDGHYFTQDCAEEEWKQLLSVVGITPNLYIPEEGIESYVARLHAISTAYFEEVT